MPWTSESAAAVAGGRCRTVAGRRQKRSTHEYAVVYAAYRACRRPARRASGSRRAGGSARARSAGTCRRRAALRTCRPCTCRCRTRRRPRSRRLRPSCRRPRTCCPSRCRSCTRRPSRSRRRRLPFGALAVDARVALALRVLLAVLAGSLSHAVAAGEAGRALVIPRPPPLASAALLGRVLAGQARRRAVECVLDRDGERLVLAAGGGDGVVLPRRNPG